MTISRRQSLGLIAAASAAACSTNQTDAPTPEQTPSTEPTSVAKPKAFRHGVASGDPTSSAVILWTRVSDAEDGAVVTWELARTAEFSDIVQSGDAVAEANRDFTIKIDATDLEDGQAYYYRFKLGEETSVVGRTKTLPVGALDKLGVALVSCSNYPFGFFNAYMEIAKDPEIDVVLHTGDYIYEYGGEQGWGHETGKVIGRVHQPMHEIVSLADYRMRHAQYKSDAGSVAMHAAHPLLCIWDDHESTNNPWKDGAQNHQPDTEGDWKERRAAAIQAYYEWMPIREPAPDMTRAQAWRTYSFGDLATLVTMETRHTGRDEQIEYGPWIDKIKTKEDRDAFMRDVVDAPRPMLSAGMEDEFRSAFGRSVMSGQPWRLIGSPSPIARMLVPDVESLVDLSNPPKGEVPGAGANLQWKAKWNLPFYTDTWDGYPQAREAFYDLCQTVGADDLVFLTGDSHSFWANELFDDEGRRMGVELGTAGVTSPGDFDETGWSEETSIALDKAFAELLDEVKWTDNMHQGYVRVVFSRDAAAVDYVAMDTVLSTDYQSSVIRSETVVRSDNSVAFSAD